MRRFARPFAARLLARHAKRPHVHHPDGQAIFVSPGVFDPVLTKVGAWLAGITSSLVKPGEKWLELGCGSGIVSLAMARAGAVVTAVDLDAAACRNTRMNATLHDLPVEVLHGDLFEPVASRRFDGVIANLPFWPSQSGKLPLGHAFDAGKDYALLRRFVAESTSYAPNAYLVLSESFADFAGARTALGPTMPLVRRQFHRGEWMNLFHRRRPLHPHQDRGDQATSALSSRPFESP